jgi:V/A-type H+-transporting ATPase subunit C
MATFSGGIYLNTRVSLFARRLLTDEQIGQLPQLGFDDIAKSYGLTAIQDASAPVNLRLKVLESALINIVLNDLVILARPMSGEAREMVVHWARKFELFNLKALIRGKLSEVKETEIRATLHDLPSYLALPHQALLRTESVLELLRQLEKGPYHAIASQARKSYEEHMEPFFLDAAIDQLYCVGMIKRAEKLKGIDRSETTKVVGLHIDRITLLWLLRYRFTYNLSPSEAYYQLVHSPLHMKRGLLLSLANLSTWEVVINALPLVLRRGLEGVASIAEVERRMHAMNIRSLRTVIARSRSAVARSLAYLMLRDLDLKRLFTVVQCQLLELDADILHQALGLQVSDTDSPATSLPTAKAA